MSIIKCVLLALGVSIAAGCVPKTESATFSAEVPNHMDLLLTGRAADFGPSENTEDQFRFMSCTDFGLVPGLPPFYSEMRDLGLNGHVVIFWGKDHYDLAQDCPRVFDGEKAAQLKLYLDKCLEDGIGVMPRMSFPHDPWLMKRYPRILKDGSASLKNIDASNPEAARRILNAVACVAKRTDHPAVVGFQNMSEVRDHSHPSFTPEMRAAYQSHSGHDVPEEVLSSKSVNGREPPHWSGLRDFPKDRVIDDDHPILDFYSWIWRKGDGWIDLLDAVNAAFTTNIRRKVFSQYSPSIRTPAFWGHDVCGDTTFQSYWTYPYPEPYNVCYDISEQQARAKKTTQGIFAMIQAISYRSHIAPLAEHPTNEPAWTKEFPNTSYPTTPPDMMREALWATFARKVDGIGFHGWQSLWDAHSRVPAAAHYQHGSTFYQCTNPQLAPVMTRIMNEVAIPLGPLFRAIPEREPRVAVVESYATLFLCSRVYSNCLGMPSHYGVAATSANLMPATLTEDEIRERGIPDSVETLIMSSCDVLTRKCYDKIMAFKARGGRILADSRLCPALKSDGTLPAISVAFPRSADDHDDGKSGSAAAADLREKSVRFVAAWLRANVGEQALPPADSDSYEIKVWTRSYRGADYVFAINDKRTYGDYCGAWRRVKEKGLPHRGTVFVRRAAGAVYDLVRHERIPFRVKDGKTFVDVAYETCDGKVFLVYDRPLSPLTIRVSGSRVAVTTPDHDVLIPIRLDGVGRKPFYAIVRNGAYIRDFASMSSCDVIVTNLANGERAYKE